MVGQLHSNGWPYTQVYKNSTNHNGWIKKKEENWVDRERGIWKDLEETVVNMINLYEPLK